MRSPQSKTQPINAEITQKNQEEQQKFLGKNAVVQKEERKKARQALKYQLIKQHESEVQKIRQKKCHDTKCAMGVGVGGFVLGAVAVALGDTSPAILGLELMAAVCTVHAIDKYRDIASIKVPTLDIQAIDQQVQDIYPSDDERISPDEANKYYATGHNVTPPLPSCL